MSGSEGQTTGERSQTSALAPVVAEVMQEATKRSGKALALALRIEALVGRSYSDRTVSAWNRGSIMPRADVLLAAAQATGISLNEKIGVEVRSPHSDPELDQLRREVKEQANSLAFLYERLEAAGISLDAQGRSGPADARGATG